MTPRHRPQRPFKGYIKIYKDIYIYIYIYISTNASVLRLSDVRGLASVTSANERSERERAFVHVDLTATYFSCLCRLIAVFVDL